ncbi:MAG: PAS domain-containing protein [Janthinobacterium lividum]
MARSEERQLSRALEQQVEDRTRERDRIWQVSQDMLGVADGRGVWISVNPAWTRILGWPAERIVGHTSEWLEHPEDRERTRAEVANLAAGHTTLAFENRFAMTDGQYRTLSWKAVPAEGLLYAVARDVTVERERERTLHDLEDFTRLALSAVGGVGVWTYEVASDRFFCDAAISELYGLDAVRAAAGIERAAFLANVHPDDFARLRSVMAGGLVRSGDLELEYRIRRPDGSIRWVLSRGHTYFNDTGEPTRRTGIGIETTKRHQLEETLLQSQKMEAVGQLTGGLAHDFNNLLTSIAGSLELLQARVAQGRMGSLDRYITMAQSAASRAAALTHRLLAFSRRQTLDPKPTDMNRLIAGLEDLIRRTAGPTITVEIVGSADLPPALVDPNQLENALLNLCINARDAMPDGGRLTVETSRKQVDTHTAVSLDVPEADYLTLSVTDNGTGMTSDVLARAFDPFFTTKPLGEGTGLGLAMIYGFARQSNGQARIHSKLGQGTTVCLYLPPHMGEAVEAEKQPILADAPRARQGETVLVVDDEPTIRMLITEVLEDLGYVAIEAADGAGGLHVLRSDARIDLLVTDVGLPGGMNGRQMAEVGRVLRPELKVLFITGYAENAAFSHSHLAAGMQVLTKPFAMEGLATQISTMMTET